jgi:hypothetical protein
MDINDIFGSDKPEPVVVPAPVLDDLAERAARARDELDYASRLYSNMEADLLKDVEERLAQLKENRESASVTLNELIERLMSAMTAAKVDAIPLPDRPPIELKLVPGRKKNPTKGFLVEQLGQATAEVIWKRLPTNPDKLEVEVPSRPDNPPSG